MNALLAMISKSLSLIILLYIITFLQYVGSVIYNKIKKIDGLTRSQKKELKSLLIACVLSLGLLLMQFQVVQDICEQRTEHVVGTIVHISTGTSRSAFAQVHIEYEMGKCVLMCGRYYYNDHFDFDVGETYEFEYFVHSKTINKAVLIDN